MEFEFKQVMIGDGAVPNLDIHIFEFAQARRLRYFGSK
jgi:hypothetical protein